MKNDTTLFNQLLTAITRDQRLKPRHMSLYVSLLYFWDLAHGQQPFSISRRRLMRQAKIKGLATYHNVIRDLHAWGYIRYEPSYHPLLGSSVYMLEQKGNEERRE